MPLSDRAFRALARDEPEVVLALIRVALPGLVAPRASVKPERVDDPNLDVPTIRDADWIARIGRAVLLHVECQGYRDPEFPTRVFRYHLGFVLRYPARRVETVVLWLTPASCEQRRAVIEI